MKSHVETSCNPFLNLNLRKKWRWYCKKKTDFLSVVLTSYKPLLNYLNANLIAEIDNYPYDRIISNPTKHKWKIHLLNQAIQFKHYGFAHKETWGTWRWMLRCFRHGESACFTDLPSTKYIFPGSILILFKLCGRKKTSSGEEIE